MASTCCWTSSSNNSRSIRNLSSCCCRARQWREEEGREGEERENRFSALDLSCVGSPLACLPAFCPGAFEAHRDSSSPSFCCSSVFVVVFFSDQRISLAAKQTNDKWTETERSKETEQNPPRTGHKTPQEEAANEAGAGTGANLLVPVSQQQ